MDFVPVAVKEINLLVVYHLLVYRKRVRRPGFEPGLPDWQSDVLDQTGRPSH